MNSKGTSMLTAAQLTRDAIEKIFVRADALRAHARDSQSPASASIEPGLETALIALYAMHVEKNTLDHLRVALVGDLTHTASAHALARALSLFAIDFSFVAPAALAMPPDICDYLRENGFSVEETNDLPKTLQKMDVAYFTGMQKDDFADPKQYEKFKTFFVLTPELVANAKPGLVVLHPAPHGAEITNAVDALPNAAYFRQAGNASFVRMALHETILG